MFLFLFIIREWDHHNHPVSDSSSSWRCSHMQSIEFSIIIRDKEGSYGLVFLFNLFDHHSSSITTETICFFVILRVITNNSLNNNNTTNKQWPKDWPNWLDICLNCLPDHLLLSSIKVILKTTSQIIENRLTLSSYVNLLLLFFIF
jgi:hypothetical protein